MSQHKAKIEWKGATPDYRLGKYTRDHTWAFDGGLTVPASAAPAVVPAAFCNPANIDPEEAFVASLSSCHMLTFLHVARVAGFQVESYEDEAVGDMAKNERGVAWVAVVTLNPKVVRRRQAPVSGAGGRAAPQGGHDLGIQRDDRDPGDAAFILGHVADGLVFVGLDLEARCASHVRTACRS